MLTLIVGWLGTAAGPLGSPLKILKSLRKNPMLLFPLHLLWQIESPQKKEPSEINFDDKSKRFCSGIFGENDEGVGVGLEFDDEESKVEESTSTRTNFNSRILNIGEEEGNLRVYKRFDKKFKIRIENEVGQVFETFTVDISAGGAQLAAPLPTWVVGYCSVKLTKVDTDESLELTCSVVEDQKPQGCVIGFSLAEMPKAKQESFERWLAA